MSKRRIHLFTSVFPIVSKQERHLTSLHKSLDMYSFVAPPGGVADDTDAPKLHQINQIGEKISMGSESNSRLGGTT
jgi:hypothetical protein